MSESALVGCTPIKTPKLNAETSKPLHDLSYKELQNMCMRFNMPANLKVRRDLFVLMSCSTCQQNVGFIQWLATLEQVVTEVDI
jgi:hypothetical protein